HGGDRLPWVPSQGSDNFAPFTAMNWQLHVYGAAKLELTEWCADRNVPLHQFAWTPQCEAAGLARDALYLLRPDTYVALAETSGAPQVVDRYCAERGLQIAAEHTAEPSGCRSYQ